MNIHTKSICLVLAFTSSLCTHATTAIDTTIEQAKQELWDLVTQDDAASTAFFIAIIQLKAKFPTVTIPGYKSIQDYAQLKEKWTLFSARLLGLLTGQILNIKDKDGRTLLMYTAGMGRTNKAKALIDAGADLNIQDPKGRTALWYAAVEGRIDAVNALIQAKADLNIQENSGGTALMAAALFGKTDVVNALIQANADLNIKSKSGKTALQMANERNNPDIVTALQNALKKTGAH